MPAGDDPPEATPTTARLRATEGAAWLAGDQQDYARATQLFERSTALRRAVGMIEDETPLLINAVIEARTAGQYARASVMLADVMAQQRAGQSRGSLIGAASAMRLQMGTPVRPSDLPALELTSATARSSLGAAAYTATLEAASTLPLQQIINSLPGVDAFKTQRYRRLTVVGS